MEHRPPVTETGDAEEMVSNIPEDNLTIDYWKSLP
jgi:hypothetical protein